MVCRGVIPAKEGSKRFWDFRQHKASYAPKSKTARWRGRTPSTSRIRSTVFFEWHANTGLAPGLVKLVSNGTSRKISSKTLITVVITFVIRATTCLIRQLEIPSKIFTCSFKSAGLSYYIWKKINTKLTIYKGITKYKSVNLNVCSPATGN